MTARPDTVLRFGVEEEFLLTDPVSRMTAPRAHLVLPRVAKRLGERAQSEFHATQVEACTPPVATAEALASEIAAMRVTMAEAADRVGCLLVASGTSVLPSHHPLPLTDATRYRTVAAHVGPIADQEGGELCGCHVHLGDLSRADALALAARLRPHLPVLQALAVNSPYCEGVHTGMASTRWARHSAWPTCGPAPVLDESGYERTARRLIADNIVLDRRMIYWYLRPSEHLPTLEVRIADTNADMEVPVLLAVLLRGLAHILLAEDRRGAPAPHVPETQLHQAHRRAAVGGLAGQGMDPVTGTLASMADLLADLYERAAPGLAEAGDLNLARTQIEAVLSGGTGAQRQRAAFTRRDRLTDVVDDLALRTRLGPAAARSTQP
ncbi:YbdK family carboxylate-amine ligase [Streptomyces sp. NPDC005209]|uniref:carboxylate-amine ligase n=1 Tax=Streptomyces sp. NPDC005209 TaxID=3156715 RepID=UPI0033B2ECA6